MHLTRKLFEGLIFDMVSGRFSFWSFMVGQLFVLLVSVKDAPTPLSMFLVPLLDAF